MAYSWQSIQVLSPYFQYPESADQLVQGPEWLPGKLDAKEQLCRMFQSCEGLYSPSIVCYIKKIDVVVFPGLVKNLFPTISLFLS